MWGGLSRIGLKAPMPGFGRMLRDWPEWAEISAAAAA